MAIGRSLIVISFGCRRDVQVRDSVYILFLFFSLVFLRNLSWFKLSQSAQNLDPGEGAKHENRIMIIGWSDKVSSPIK
jgi:hypothetical protein